MKSPETLARLEDQLALRKLLNSWDPIGLIELGSPGDEYQCLVGDVFRELRQGRDQKKIVSFLVRHFPEHFGVRVERKQIREWVRRILTWWETEAKSKGLKW